MDKPNQLIGEALTMAVQMDRLADQGQAESVDDGCILLYGIIRDCAYRIKREAAKELVKHQVTVESQVPVPVAPGAGPAKNRASRRR